jgi:hypothetical protein
MIMFREKGLRMAAFCLDEEPAPVKADRLMYLFRPEPMAKSYCSAATTLDLDLRRIPEELWSGLEKNTAYEVRRSRDKDGVLCAWLDVRDRENVDAFWKYFTDFSTLMGYPSPGEKGYRWLTRFAGDGRLLLSAAKSPQDEILAYHAYIGGLKRTRLLHACSLHKQMASPAQRALSGRANRWLFWHDILELKERGFETYDFGGWYSHQDNPQMLRVNRFKEDFGGVVKEVYNCSAGQTLLGKLVVWLHQTFRARKKNPIKP